MIKELLSSKTILGIVWILAIAIPKVFWIQISETELMVYIEQIGIGIFAVLALYWRLVAKWPFLKAKETDWTESIIQEYQVDIYDEEEVYGWAIDWIGDSDWLFWSIVDITELPNTANTFDKFKIQYNQDKQIGKNSCTVAAAMWAVSDITGLTWTEAQMRDVYESAIKEWLEPSIGWYTHKAVDLVRKKALEHLGVEVNYASLSMSDEKLRNDLMNKWYSIVTGYLGNSAYNKDKNDDWVVTKIHKPTTYWHAIRRTNKSRIVDNYFGIKYNVYTNNLIKEMLDEWTQHKWWFVFFQIKSKLDLWKEKVKSRIEAQKVNNLYLFVRKWNSRVPKRISKDFPRKQENWKTYVKTNSWRIEYRI